MATLPPVADDSARRNLRVGLMAFAGALAMLGLGYASVPLYRLFCQVTGFGGTTMQATESDAARSWASAYENYTFSDLGPSTALKVDVEPKKS